MLSGQYTSYKQPNQHVDKFQQSVVPMNKQPLVSFHQQLIALISKKHNWQASPRATAKQMINHPNFFPARTR